ncbi:MAG: aldehyde reductase [SAR86 cluster bacterium]|jgi:dihydroflavonol-4-reductase|nr:aldehyde reductase [SAR86 cluster bacterium]|tara:strand:+ start:3253 stop:4263 length:1011 start_codon:yes stop_codon:yes gene_type:complete
MDKVLVTGGTGFIGLHCIQQLLDQGYFVRTTIRSESRKEEVMKSMKKYSSNSENLEIVIADLLIDQGWDEAVNGCKYVLHVASPFVLEVPEDEGELIKPAVEGTLRVLKACRDNKIDKVVLTSSAAAIGYGHEEKKEFDESDWSKTKGSISAYAKSKTLAEKAAWDFMDNLSSEEKFELSVMNPVAVTGPMLTDDIGTSNSLLLQLVSGTMPACPKIHLGFVDVRDVAKAHIFSMTSDQTNGQRIIICEKEMFFVEVGKVLKEAGFKKSPTKELPNFLVKIMSIFIKQLGGMVPSLGRQIHYNSKKAQDIFNWKYISAEDSAIESAKQLESMGLLP